MCRGIVARTQECWSHHVIEWASGYLSVPMDTYAPRSTEYARDTERILLPVHPLLRDSCWVTHAAGWVEGRGNEHGTRVKVIGCISLVNDLSTRIEPSLGSICTEKHKTRQKRIMDSLPPPPPLPPFAARGPSPTLFGRSSNFFALESQEASDGAKEQGPRSTITGPSHAFLSHPISSHSHAQLTLRRSTFSFGFRVAFPVVVVVVVVVLS
ncbi:hypothetical protein H4I96_09375 [Botrytis cinerea]